jgi:hypothetical protein
MPGYNNLPAKKVDNTTDYFNNFFKPSFDISQDVDGAVVSFFEKVTDGKESAKLLAGAVIYTAGVQGIDFMTLLQQFAKMPKGELNAYLTMFLNLNRVGTSYLGMSKAAPASKYIARTILP